MIAACPYAWPWNVLGWPAINVPAGFADGGLPLGAQLLGPANSEPLLISLAAQLEADRRWYERWPDVQGLEERGRGPGPGRGLSTGARPAGTGWGGNLPGRRALCQR